MTISINKIDRVYKYIITTYWQCVNIVTGVSNENQRFRITCETSYVKADIKRVSRGIHCLCVGRCVGVPCVHMRDLILGIGV